MAAPARFRESWRESRGAAGQIPGAWSLRALIRSGRARRLLPWQGSLTEDGKDFRLQELLFLKPGVWSLEPRQPRWLRLCRARGSR
jgi:hypothetical protein